MTPKIVDVDQKKEDIMKATLQVLAKKGIDKFKMVDVANAMGIGKSTIYDYFSSKRELQEQALGFFINDFFDFEEDDEEITIFEFAEKSLKRLNNFAEEEKELFQVLSDIWYESIKQGFSEFEEVYNSYKNYIAQKIAAGQKQGLVASSIDPEATAGWLIATWDGLALQVLMGLNDFEQERIFQSWLKALKNHLQPEADC